MSASLRLPSAQLALEAVVGVRQAAFFQVHAASVHSPIHTGHLWIGPDVTGEEELSFFLHCDVHCFRDLWGDWRETSLMRLEWKYRTAFGKLFGQKQQ